METLPKQFGPRKIAVNVVAPSPAETDFSGGNIRDNPANHKMITDNKEIERAGLPQHIGPVTASLLWEENHWVNAQRIKAAGGFSI